MRNLNEAPIRDLIGSVNTGAFGTNPMDEPITSSSPYSPGVFVHGSTRFWVAGVGVSKDQFWS
ncbi:MAG: hypothetical protein DMG55_15825 [Acidobacteria bacterium]|nr:MAG: hypothetical protein DMG55_15825 [Acidobacteriota bacterium]